MNDGRFDRLSRTRSRERGGLDVPFDRTPLIETAEVIRVDTSLFVIDVITKVTGRRGKNLEVPGAGVERDGGFMGAMPKVGDKCLIAFPSDEIQPKLIAMLPYADPRNGMRGGRKAMDPGDKVMSTGYGNYVHVHSGGVVDLAANPITRRMYVPILNQIKDFCENYLLNTAGGRFRWEVRRDEKNGDGAETELVWQVKEYTNESRVFELRRGRVSSVEDMPDNVVEHKQTFFDDLEYYRCSIDRSGNVLVLSAGGSTESYAGKKVISAEQGLVLTSESISEFNEDPGLTRGSVHISDSDGVELAKAEEAAVLGDTLKKLLDKYDDHIFTLLSDINTAALSFATASAAATAPGAMAPVGAKYGADIATAVNKAVGNLGGVRAQFQTFLAVDTKLS